MTSDGAIASEHYTVYDGAIISLRQQFLKVQSGVVSTWWKNWGTTKPSNLVHYISIKLHFYYPLSVPPRTSNLPVYFIICILITFISYSLNGSSAAFSAYSPNGILTRDFPTQFFPSRYGSRYPDLWVGRYRVPIRYQLIKNNSLHISFDFSV